VSTATHAPLCLAVQIYYSNLHTFLLLEPNKMNERTNE